MKAAGFGWFMRSTQWLTRSGALEQDLAGNEIEVEVAVEGPHHRAIGQRHLFTQQEALIGEDRLHVPEQLVEVGLDGGDRRLAYAEHGERPRHLIGEAAGCLAISGERREGTARCPSPTRVRSSGSASPAGA